MIGRTKDVEFNEIFDNVLELSKEFVKTFPKMAELLERALIIEFTIESNQRFRQYIWTNEDGSTTGWLCRLEHQIPKDIKFITEHVLFTKNVGGIVDYWIGVRSDEIETFIDSNFFTFQLKDSAIGIANWEDHYLAKCKEDNIEQPLDTSQLVCFALEANGTPTLYDIRSKEIYLYLFGDYSPFDTSMVEGQSSCTFYQYSKVKTFVDYVEELATQWNKVLNG